MKDNLTKHVHFRLQLLKYTCQEPSLKKTSNTHLPLSETEHQIWHKKKYSIPSTQKVMTFK